MNRWSKRVTVTAILLGSAVAVSGVAAGATGLGADPVKSTRIVSDNDLGAAVGNVAPNVGVNACGNSVAVLGHSGDAGCQTTQKNSSRGKAKVDNDGGRSHKGYNSYGHGNDGWDKRGRKGRGGDKGSSTKVLSDNDLGAAIGNIAPNVGLNVCGNSVAVLGHSGDAGCQTKQKNSSRGKAKVSND